MQSPARKRESPIVPICAVTAVVTVFVMLPGRYRLLPIGSEYLIGGGLVLALAIGAFSPADTALHRLQRIAIISFACLGTATELGIFARLMHDMIAHDRTVDALVLLSTAVTIWISNVVIFSLLYWQVDRGGPNARAAGFHGRADFSFPRGEPEDGVPEDWQPQYLDYLFLAFTAATAFSPTDALPMTQRAKMLLMTEATISLVTVVAVAARAINILGT